MRWAWMGLVRHRMINRHDQSLAPDQHPAGTYPPHPAHWREPMQTLGKVRFQQIATLPNRSRHAAGAADHPRCRRRCHRAHRSRPQLQPRRGRVRGRRPEGAPPGQASRIRSEALGRAAQPQGFDRQAEVQGFAVGQGGGGQARPQLAQAAQPHPQAVKRLQEYEGVLLRWWRWVQGGMTVCDATRVQCW